MSRLVKYPRMGEIVRLSKPEGTVDILVEKITPHYKAELRVFTMDRKGNLTSEQPLTIYIRAARLVSLLDEQVRLYTSRIQRKTIHLAIDVDRSVKIFSLRETVDVV